EVGKLVAGATSKATALVVGIDGGTLLLANVKGSFQDGEVIAQAAAAGFANGTLSTRDTFGEVDLGLTVQPGFDDIGFGDGFALLDGHSYGVPVSLTGFGVPIDDPAVAPVAELDLTGLGDLLAFRHLGYQDLAHALHGLETLLVDVNQSFELFNTKLPAINRS